MTMRPDDLAREHYAAELRSRPGGTGQRRLRWLGTFVSGLLEGLVPAPSLQDLVVVRRADGIEVLRTPAGEANEATALLNDVERQLETETVASFSETWTLDDTTG